MAQNLTMEAPMFEFGKCSSYHKVYFFSLYNEFVTLQKFHEGTFTKDIKNTGSIFEQTNEEPWLRISKELVLVFATLKYRQYSECM